MKYILSYGGGINSSALFFWLTKNNKPIDEVIFADTGEETIQTHDAVRRMKEECKQRNIPFTTVQSKHGKLYDYYYNKKAVPSVMKRDCTGKFKVAPIRQYIRKKYGKEETFTMYIGIASEEWSRVKDSDVKYIKNEFPFVDHNINREENNKILQENQFPAQKSGCIGCIYLKKKEWFAMAVNNTKEFDRWLALDENNKAYPRVTHSPRIPLRKIKDAAQGQTTLPVIEDTIPTCDVYGGCFL